MPMGPWPLRHTTGVDCFGLSGLHDTVSTLISAISCLTRLLWSGIRFRLGIKIILRLLRYAVPPPPPRRGAFAQGFLGVLSRSPDAHRPRAFVGSPAVRQSHRRTRACQGRCLWVVYSVRSRRRRRRFRRHPFAARGGVGR